MRVLIVADDLTGALDSAVALVGAGLTCVVARRPADVPAALAMQPDVLSVSTASREGDAGAARAAVAAVLAAAGPLPPLVVKKVDSRLKGHVADEVAVLAGHAGYHHALVAPAIPAQGRTVVAGRLIGAGVAAPIDVAAALAGSGLEVVVPDVSTDADLDGALAALAGGPPTLLVGAAGLTAALARRLSPGRWAMPVPRLQAPVLLAIGSRDPITLAQVDRLVATGWAAVTPAPDGLCPAGAGGRGVLRMVAGGGAFDARAAGERFAEGIAQLVRAEGVGTLLGCGGETADAILGALGQGVLVIDGEVLPGMPVSGMVVDGRRVQLVTKSGGFGAVDALVAMVAAAEAGERTR
ncbi:MAG: four-carbon acid sugar kinase family protein [Amaricoccus sp.]|uniref:four-carbon acid sugar kinase family protein n=1 Tax=Amaricoccus sp. TaxID=1872485 RepID=UPI0039E6649F